MARRTLVPTIKHYDVKDTDEDLVTQLKQDKKLTPRKVPFNSPIRSNKQMLRSLKGNSHKPHYDPIMAQNMCKVDQDAMGIKLEPQEDAVQFGS